jgi:hypothetical protein
MFMTKQSEVVEAVKGQGLKEISEPPVVLDKALRKANKTLK